jgi:hypothetical protein
VAHGITLKLRGIEDPAPESISARVDGHGWFAMVVNKTHRGPSRDRSLPGKARRRARKAARRLERRPFFKGHGIASANAHNLRYDCTALGCGYGIVAPLDDHEFMTDVMEHEIEHTEAATR